MIYSTVQVQRVFNDSTSLGRAGIKRYRARIKKRYQERDSRLACPVPTFIARPWSTKDVQDHGRGFSWYVRGEKAVGFVSSPATVERRLPGLAHFDWSGNIACSPPAVRALPAATWKNYRIEMHSLIILAYSRARSRGSTALRLRSWTVAHV